MAEYTLVVRIPQAGNNEVVYRLALSRLYESHPDDYFRNEPNREALCQYIQAQSQRQVTAKALDAMISKWIADIRCGLYRTVVTLELPPETYTSSGTISGLPVTPATPGSTFSSPSLSPTDRLPAKKPQPKTPQKPTITTQPPNTSAKAKSDSASPKAAEPEKPSEEPPPPDIRTDTNRADF